MVNLPLPCKLFTTLQDDKLKTQNFPLPAVGIPNVWSKDLHLKLNQHCAWKEDRFFAVQKGKYVLSSKHPFSSANGANCSPLTSWGSTLFNNRGWVENGEGELLLEMHSFFGWTMELQKEGNHFYIPNHPWALEMLCWDIPRLLQKPSPWVID